MSELIFTAPQTPTLAVAGDARRFPVRRIFCVGRNYAEHVREMGTSPETTPPAFFTKPADAVVDADPSLEAAIPYPPATRNFHYEVELVVALGAGGADVPAAHAAELIFGGAVGLDLTRRDLQQAAKAQQGPWDMAKGFDLSAPCGALVPLTPAARLDEGRIFLAVNGALKQDGDLSQMIWPVAGVLAELSKLVKLQPGDLVFTGTPAGVGPLVRGDRVTAEVEGFGALALRIA